jgi:hypothetical protein
MSRIRALLSNPCNLKILKIRLNAKTKMFPDGIAGGKELLCDEAIHALDWQRIENDLGGQGCRCPECHDKFVKRCHDAGQLRPTPLLLQYGEGNYNCLHQDLYGEHVFPIQVAILLSEPARDFTGGEFVLTEQRSPHAITTRGGSPSSGRRCSFRGASPSGTGNARNLSRQSSTWCKSPALVGVIFHDANEKTK